MDTNQLSGKWHQKSNRGEVGYPASILLVLAAGLYYSHHSLLTNTHSLSGSLRSKAHSHSHTHTHPSRARTHALSLFLYFSLSPFSFFFLHSHTHTTTSLFFILFFLYSYSICESQILAFLIRTVLQYASRLQSTIVVLLTRQQHYRWLIRLLIWLIWLQPHLASGKSCLWMVV